jgi:hypothetical protein
MKTMQRTDSPCDEPSDRERRIKAGYRRRLRAVLDGKGGESEVQSLKSKVQSLRSEVRHPKRGARAAEVYLSRFACVGFVLALAVTGCAGPRPLKGGKAVVTRTPGGSVQQTLIQSENPAQATKQDNESIKVRTYTVPAGSRMERSLNAECGVRSAECGRPKGGSAKCQRSTFNLLRSQPGTINYQLSTLSLFSPECPNAGSRA